MKKITWIFAVGLVLVATSLLLQAADEGSKGDESRPPRRGMRSPGRAGGPAGMGEGMGRRSRRGRRKPITPEQEKQILEFSKEHMKHHYDRLMKLREENERAYRRTLGFLWPRVQSMMSMSPEMRQAHLDENRLRVEIFQTVKDYREAIGPEEKEELKQELQELVARKFDAEQKVREYRLRELEAQLSRLKKQLIQRTAERGKIIEDKIGRLLTKRKLPGPGHKEKSPSPPKDAPTENSFKTEQPPKSDK